MENSAKKNLPQLTKDQPKEEVPDKGKVVAKVNALDRLNNFVERKRE